VSVVIIPGQFHAAPHPAGKLASTLLSVTVAGMADPARFRRGKAYVTEHNVHRLEVAAGHLTATVAGSREQQYHVVAAVSVMPPITVESPEALRTQLTRLTPDAGDLMLSCTCPDMDEPCKHQVAALLAFAAELVTRPELLLQWRCAPSGDEPQRARVGARAKPAERHLRLAPPLAERAEQGNQWETPDWVKFLGQMPPEPPAVPREPAAIGRASLGIIDLAAVVRSALDELRRDD
jgi:uncharacterized Zn finger protein